MKVKITSPCMAMLVYEAAKSEGQTEGCLHGEIATEVTKNITDSDVTTSTEEVLSMHSICPLRFSRPEPGNKNSNESHIYGWYKFCRRPSLRLSVREKSIHRKLANCLTEINGSPSHMVTILMHERWSENHSTYLWKFAAFVQHDSRWFIPCKVEIVNLKATVCGAYKPYPSVHQRQRSPQVTGAMSSLNQTFSSCGRNSSFDMVDTVRNTGQDIVKYLNTTISQFRATEVELETAYEEQERLRMILRDLQSVQDSHNEEKNNRISERFSDLNDSSDSETSDSSESAEYYGEDKTNELLQDLKDERGVFHDRQNVSDNIACASTSFQGRPSSLKSEEIAAVINSGDNDPPPPYDPFDSLVNMAKADLKKTDSSDQPCSSKHEDELLAEYNDERPWSDKTRAGRLKNNQN